MEVYLIMNTNYYQDKRFEYPEIAVAMEDFYYKGKGKFFIPILFPELTSKVPYSNETSRGSISNIVNYNKRHGIKNVVVSNYIELTVPEYISEHIKDESNMIKEGTEFIIVFIGGEINKPRIIGVN